MFLISIIAMRGSFNKSVSYRAFTPRFDCRRRMSSETIRERQTTDGRKSTSTGSFVTERSWRAHEVLPLIP